MARPTRRSLLKILAGSRASLRAFAPPTQFLFGTDFPIEPAESTVEPFPVVKLPVDLRHALDRGSAERLWPRFKQS